MSLITSTTNLGAFPKSLSLLLFFCATVSPSPAKAQTVPVRQLTLIQPNDPSFDNLLTTNFPGLDRLDGYATYRPFLVLLRNDTQNTVRAYMLQWEARSLNGEPFRLQDLIERYDPAPASERVALAPGALRLVSDHFDVSPKEYQSLHQHNWVAAMMAQAGANPRYASADPNSVVAAVDAAVFDDDTCVGPDHYKVCQRLQTAMDAEQDVAQELLQLLDRKASEADVVAYLKSLTDASTTAAATVNGAAFDRAFWRGRQGERLLAFYKRGGLESVMDRAWRVTQHPRKKLSPVALQ